MNTTQLGVGFTIIVILLIAVFARSDQGFKKTSSNLASNQSIIHSYKLQNNSPTIYEPEIFSFTEEKIATVENEIKRFSPEPEFIARLSLPELETSDETDTKQNEEEHYMLLELTRDRSMAESITETDTQEQNDTEQEQVEERQAYVSEPEYDEAEEDGNQEQHQPVETPNIDSEEQTNDSTNANPSSAINADALINEAKKHEGTRFVFGGTTPNGFDCSGFIYYVLNQVGYDINRTSSAGYYDMTESTSNPTKGDFVFFAGTYKSGISHLGIMINDNEFIHAGSDGVEIDSLDEGYWQSHFAGYRTLS